MAAVDAVALAVGDIVTNERRQRVLRGRLGPAYLHRGAQLEELLADCLHGHLCHLVPGGALPFVSTDAALWAAGRLLDSDMIGTEAT